jgi:hypothetical protein
MSAKWILYFSCYAQRRVRGQNYTIVNIQLAELPPDGTDLVKFQELHGPTVYHQNSFLPLIGFNFGQLRAAAGFSGLTIGQCFGDHPISYQITQD